MKGKVIVWDSERVCRDSLGSLMCDSWSDADFIGCVNSNFRSNMGKGME